MQVILTIETIIESFDVVDSNNAQQMCLFTIYLHLNCKCSRFSSQAAIQTPCKSLFETLNID